MTKQDQKQLQKALEMMQKAQSILDNVKDSAFIHECRFDNKPDSKLNNAIRSLEVTMLNIGAK